MEIDNNSTTTPFTLKRTIVAGNVGAGIALFGSNVTGECNDSWGNSLEDYLPDVSGSNGNFSSDPLFCGPEIRDLTLKSTSPCLPDQHPAGEACGQIGSHAEGCQAVPTLPVSWSGIKLLPRP